MSEAILAVGEDAVAAAIQAAATAGETVEIVGGGSKLGLGRPVRAKRRLDVGGFAGITLYEPAELVLRARAGTRLADIEAALAANGQALAFEPPDLGGLLGAPPAGQTLGGVVATNLSGPRRPVAGAVRDHVLGLRAVNGRGEAFKAGGRVVKNVTGYDLCKLLTGSFGTLAVLTEVTVKVLPAAETEQTMVIAGLPADRAVKLMADALGRPIGPSATAWLPAGLAGRTVAGTADAPITGLRLEGFGPSVAARRRQLEALIGSPAEAWALPEEVSRQFWRQIGSVQPFHRQAGRAVWKATLPPTDAPAVLVRLAAVADVEAFLDWGGGLMWISLPCGADAQAAAVRAALPADGQATLVAAPEAVRAGQPVFHPLPPAVAALQANLKARFDPAGILNPGRM